MGRGGSREDGRRREEEGRVGDNMKIRREEGRRGEDEGVRKEEGGEKE